MNTDAVCTRILATNARAVMGISAAFDIPFDDDSFAETEPDGFIAVDDIEDTTDWADVDMMPVPVDEPEPEEPDVVYPEEVVAETVPDAYVAEGVHFEVKSGHKALLSTGSLGNMWDIPRFDGWRRSERSWKSHRLTQWREPEPNFKSILAV